MAADIGAIGAIGAPGEDSMATGVGSGCADNSTDDSGAVYRAIRDSSRHVARRGATT